jgi:hypothetical protein
MIRLYIVAYSLKARTVGSSQQPAVTRQRLVNNRVMVFSTRFVPMTAPVTMEYVIPKYKRLKLGGGQAYDRSSD